jgi:hypothetical protein
MIARILPGPLGQESRQLFLRDGHAAALGLTRRARQQLALVLGERLAADLLPQRQDLGPVPLLPSRL